ncbi:DUF2877 domain-containing protein [Terrarubrum flagellatum]|uniref:DUF2877 domain-containing protein n=1 Tax=Terrirubrum flagellatum TaxID=2895980 RepID=UPI0031456FDB
MRLRVARLGPFARRFLETHQAARVSAMFARSLHLEADQDALCIVDASLGDGALNAVLEAPFGALREIAVGAPCILHGGVIVIAGADEIAFGDASEWRPPQMRAVPQRQTLDALLEAALSMAPREGVFRAALDPDFSVNDLMTRALAARIAALREWMAERLKASQIQSDPPVTGLVGLGSGLTPAGDDFIGGAMIALHGIGRVDAAREVADAISRLGDGATTILSRAMLRAAAEGVGGAALHEVLSALGDDDIPRAVALLSDIDRIGHTSGWDALAGAIAALRL